MKSTKWLIIIALLCYKTISYSQNFINDSKLWADVSLVQPTGTTHYETNYFKFNGDTVINGGTFHKLYSSTDSMQLNWSLRSLWWERNDSVFQYCHPCGWINDSSLLVYNFNLAEGDTFTLYPDYLYMKVDSIRFLQWGGSIRKHWFFCKTNSDTSSWNRTIWIEGVGQLGLMSRSSDIDIMGAYNQLLCFHENGNLIYQNPNYTDCYVYTNVPAITKSNEHINLFPNPASTKLTFTIPKNSNSATYTLYNLQGVVQLAGNNNKTETELNVSSLQRGLYFLKISTNKKTITKKVVLN